MTDSPRENRPGVSQVGALEGVGSVQINITARHGHLSPNTQTRITEKVERVRKFYDRVTLIHVTVDLEHADEPSVEMVVSAEHHEDFVASDRSGSLMAALDSVVHKVEVQLRKHKEKRTDHRAVGHKHLDVAGPASE
jgi:putative sigma-54 modulation protein